MPQFGVMPEIVASASENLQGVGSCINAAQAAAAAQTTAIAPAAADEISAAITGIFSTFARDYQLVGAKAAAYHDAFVVTLNGAAGQYAHAEIGNARQLLTNSAAAVANPAETAITNQIFSLGPLSVTQTFGNTGQAVTAALNTPVGPAAALSLSSSYLGIGQGGLEFRINETGLVNTPKGPVQLFSETGTAITSPSGVSLLANATLGSPSGPFWISQTQTGGGTFGTDGEIWLDANLSTPFGTFLGVTGNLTGFNGPLPWLEVGLHAAGLDVPIGAPFPLPVLPD
jgi:hypothetical protein